MQGSGRGCSRAAAAQDRITTSRLLLSHCCKQLGPCISGHAISWSEIPGGCGPKAVPSLCLPVSATPWLLPNPRAEGTVNSPRVLKYHLYPDSGQIHVFSPDLIPELRTGNCPLGISDVAKTHLVTHHHPYFPLKNSSVLLVPTVGSMVPSSGCLGQPWSQPTSPPYTNASGPTLRIPPETQTSATSCLDRCPAASPVTPPLCWDPWSLLNSRRLDPIGT